MEIFRRLFRRFSTKMGKEESQVHADVGTLSDQSTLQARPISEKGPMDGQILVFEPECLVCGATMKPIKNIGLGLGGGTVKCHRCGERYLTRFASGRLTFRRVSVPVGFAGIVEKTYTGNAKGSGASKEKPDTDCYSVITAGMSLSKEAQVDYCASIGEHLSGFTSDEIIDSAEKAPNVYCLAVLLGALQGKLIADERSYYVWYLVAFSCQKLGLDTLAKACTVKALTFTDNPDANAWRWLKNYFPETAWDLLQEDKKREKVAALLQASEAVIPSGYDQIAAILRRILLPQGVRWEYVHPKGICEAIVKGELVCIKIGGIHTISTETGRLRWQACSHERIDRIWVAPDSVFAFSGSHVIKLDLMDGSIVWKKSLPLDYVHPGTAFLEIGSRLLVAGKGKSGLEYIHVVCLDKVEGMVHWACDIRGYGLCLFRCPEMPDTVIILTDGYCAAIDVETGNKKWQIVNRWDTLGHAVMQNNSLLFTSPRFARDTVSAIYSLRCAEGEIVWTFGAFSHENRQISPNEWEGLVAHEEKIYAVAETGKLGCFIHDLVSLRGTDGQPLWISHLGRRGSCGDIMATKHKVFVIFPREILAYDARNGSLIWEHEESRDNAPIFSHGMLSDKNEIWVMRPGGYTCLDTESGKVLTSKLFDSLGYCKILSLVEGGMVFSTQELVARVETMESSHR